MPASVPLLYRSPVTRASEWCSGTCPRARGLDLPPVDPRDREPPVTDRLEARVADMRDLDFADGSFDLIWCEGAIYNVGIEAGLRD